MFFLFEKKISHNLKKIYILNFFMMFLVTIPIIVPYWQKLGLSIKEVYQLQAVFGLMMIILDVPAGYISDIFGRKKTLILVGLFNIITYQLLLRGTTFFDFVLFEISASFAFALYSGCDIALIYDTLDSEKLSHNVEAHYLSKRVFYAQLGETIAAFLGGILAVKFLKLPLIVNSYTSIIPFFIALTLVEPERKKLNSKEHIKNLKFIIHELFFKSKFLTSLIVFNIFFGFSTFVAVWSYQVYWTELSIPLSYFGVLWAAFNLSVALIARFAVQIEKLVNPIMVIFFISISPIIAYFGLSYFRSIWVLLFFLLFALTRGLNSVILQDGINSRVPSTIRATTFSICSLGMRGVFFIFGPMIGAEIDRNGVRSSYQILGICFSLGFIFIALPLLFQYKNFKKIKTKPLI